jgi:hypothetical protein
MTPKATHRSRAPIFVAWREYAVIVFLIVFIFRFRNVPIYGITVFNVEKACNAPKSPSLERLWMQIDSIVAQHPNLPVSGGVFLCPRHTAMLTLITKALDRKTKRPLQICETGFGGGHSMALFLDAAPTAEFYSFETYERRYQNRVWKLLLNHTDSRKKRFIGDSCLSVPAKFPDLQCDLLHGSSLCQTDSIDIVENSPCGVVLTAAAMHELEDDLYFGEHGQWRQLRDRGCIEEVACFTDEEMQLDREFIFRKQGETITLKFCFAVTTGKCSKLPNKCSPERDMRPLLHELGIRFNKLCPDFRVDPPK